MSRICALCGRPITFDFKAVGEDRVVHWNAAECLEAIKTAIRLSEVEGPLARFPAGDGQSFWLNPAHVAAIDPEKDPGRCCVRMVRGDLDYVVDLPPDEAAARLAAAARRGSR